MLRFNPGHCATACFRGIFIPRLADNAHTFLHILRDIIDKKTFRCTPVDITGLFTGIATLRELFHVRACVPLSLQLFLIARSQRISLISCDLLISQLRAMLSSTFFALLIGASFAICGLTPVQVRRRSDSRHSSSVTTAGRAGRRFAFSVPPRPLPQPSVRRLKYCNNPGWFRFLFGDALAFCNLIPPVPYSTPPYIAVNPE